MKFKATVMIVCQTISSIGFGISIICLYLLKLPGGYDIVAKILGRPDPPIMPIVAMSVLCAVVMVVLTFGNTDITLTAINEIEGK